MTATPTIRIRFYVTKIENGQIRIRPVPDEIVIKEPKTTEELMQSSLYVDINPDKLIVQPYWDEPHKAR
jgi:hypothetical protein